MSQAIQQNVLVIMYIGDVLFAMSGAFTAGRNRMDLMGYLMIGTVTGIGGGTLRDLLLGRTVWWTQNPFELLLCVGASLLAYSLLRTPTRSHRSIVWLDALGLSSFAVVGAHVAMVHGVPPVVAMFMGMVTATGGGVIRDVLTGTKPMILSAGELYATAALGGACVYVVSVSVFDEGTLAQFLGIATVMVLRASSILFGFRLGPPDEFLSWRRRRKVP